MPVVVIELVASHPPPAMVQAMVDACSSSVRDGSCAIDGQQSPSEPSMRAVVRWDATELDAHVDVGAPLLSGSWLERDLAFAEEDEPRERWRAVGITIATLASEISGRPDHPGSPSSPAVTAPTPAAQREPVSPRAGVVSRTPPGIWAGVTGAIGPGLESGSPRLGGWVDVGWRPFTPPVFGRLAIGYAVRAADQRQLMVDWKTVTVGVGAVFPAGPLRLEPRIGGGLVVTRASAQEAEGDTDAQSRVAIGLYAGVDLVFRVSRVGIVGAFDAWHLDSRTPILVAGTPAGVSSQNGWSAGIGVRWYFSE